jgi:hydrogenase expression/formation protein HypC
MCLAIPGQVIEIVDPVNQIAKVDIVGVRRNVNVGLLADDDDGGAQPGDWVLIHVGFAMSKIDESEARATREFLEMLGEPYEQELAELKGSGIE